MSTSGLFLTLETGNYFKGSAVVPVPAEWLSLAGAGRVLGLICDVCHRHRCGGRGSTPATEFPPLHCIRGFLVLGDHSAGQTHLTTFEIFRTLLS